MMTQNDDSSKCASLPVFECLEPRTLLSGGAAGTPAALTSGSDYDLSIAVISTTLPPSVVEQTLTKGTAKVNILLGGTSKLPGKTAVDVNLVLRPGSGPDVPVGHVANVSLAALKANKPKPLNVPLTIPKSIAANTYSLVAIVDSTSRLAETNESNNQATGPYSITAGPVCSDLAIQANDTFDDTPTAGDKATGKVHIQNIGNTTAAGMVTITFRASRAGVVDTVFGTTTTKLNLKPGATTRCLNVPLTIPDTLPTSGDYQVAAYITPSAAILGDVASNNYLYRSLTITVPPMSFSAVGNQLTFRNEVRGAGDGVIGIVSRSGDFTDGYGNGGTYLLVANPVTNPAAPKEVQLNLYYEYDSVYTLYLTFKSRVTALGNKKLVFRAASAGSNGTLVDEFYGGAIHYYNIVSA